MTENNGLKLLSKYRGSIMGFAALWIMFFHEWIPVLSNVPYLNFIEQFFKRIGFCGVDIFFFLSGMGLTFSIKKSKLLVFYGKRLKKIIFPFLAMAILRGIVEKWPMNYFWGNVTGYNFYTKSIYSFLWFVPAIATIYLLFPLYYRLFERASDKMIFTVAAIVVWLILSIYFSKSMREDLFGFTNRIAVFMIGVFIGWRLQQGECVFSRLHWIALGLILILGLYLGYLTNFEGMGILVPVSNCCVPNILMSTSGSFLLAKGLDCLNNSKWTKRLGNAITKILSFFGIFTLEFYCVQEWLGGQIYNKLPNSGNMTKNIIIFVCVTITAFLVHLIGQGLWNMLGKIHKTKV